jgi:hypothetical protein
VDAGVPATDGPLEYEEIELGTGQSFIPLLKVGADRIGCSLVAEDAEPTPGVAYQCEQGMLFMAQVGQTLRYTCQRMELAACRGLMERIYQKVLDAAGGKGP